MRKEGASRPGVELHLFDFCRLFTQAYEKAFSTDKIRAGFRKTGLWPVDATELLSNCRPLNECNLFQIVDLYTMMTMVDRKRKKFASGGKQLVVLKNGFIDTSQGIVLTSARAMELIQAKEEHEQEKALETEKKKRAIELKEAEHWVQRKKRPLCHRSERERNSQIRIIMDRLHRLLITQSQAGM